MKTHNIIVQRGTGKMKLVGLNSKTVKGREPGTVYVVPSFTKAVDSLGEASKDKDGKNGKQRDIYAFGLVLLNMLTLRYASKGLNVHKLLDAEDEEYK